MESFRQYCILNFVLKQSADILRRVLHDDEEIKLQVKQQIE